MNKSYSNLIIILCSIIAALLLIIIIALVTGHNQKDFSEQLAEIDSNINGGFYTEAENRFASVFTEINNSKESLSFLKRVYRYASVTGKYSLLSGYSDRLYSDYSSNIEIAAIAAYAHQKNNNYVKSYTISKNKLSKSDYFPIHLLNIIENDFPIEDAKIRQKIDQRYLFLLSPDRPDKEALISSAEELFDQRLFLDASLIMMKEGSKNEAYEILKKIEDKNFSTVKTLVAFDNYDFKSAEKYFTSIDLTGADSKIQLIGADIYMHNGRNFYAADIYKKIIAEDPSEYSVPYRNLYSIYIDLPERITWLDKGLQYFPYNSDLLVSASWEYYLNNDFYKLEQLSENFDKENSTVSEELLNIKMMQKGRSPEHVIGNFWNVFNMDPNSDITAVSFANYLLRNRHFEQLELLLKKYADNNGFFSWTYSYRGIEEAMQGKTELAFDDMKKALSLENSALNLYNLAVLQELNDDNSGSEKNLQKALLISEPLENNLKDLSKIYFKLSETNYNMRQFEDASYYIERAIELNPDDTKNRLLSGRIKEEYND